MAKTSKLFEYGLEVAKVGKILFEPSDSSTRTKLMSMGNVYVPKNNPENVYFAYCAAIIDAILDLYRGASYNSYEQIIMQWRTPGCQSVIKPFQDNRFKSKNASQYFIGLSQLMASIENPGNEDWKKLEYHISDWIKKCCNRPSDLKMGKVNIQAEKTEASKYLTLALLFRSLGEYLKLSFDDMNVYRGEARNIMEQRKHSRAKDKLIKSLKKAGLGLQYGSNIKETAYLWVRVRILRPYNITIDEFAADKGISKRKLLDRLLPFDKAMGYTRQPG